GFFDFGNKYFAVADLPGLGGFDDGGHRCVQSTVGHYKFDFDFRQKIHRVLAAAIDFRMAFLAAETLHFRDGHAFRADLGQRVLNFLQLEWFNDRFDFLHIGLGSETGNALPAFARGSSSENAKKAADEFN